MPESGSGQGMWTAPEGGDDTLREQAKTAWSMALTATVLAMLSPCMGYVSLFAALPLGLVALSRSRRILETGSDEATEVYARTARTLGIAAAAFSGFFLVMLILIVFLYAGLIAFVIAAEA